MTKQLQVTGITVGSRRHQLELIGGFEALGIRPIVDRGFDPAFLAVAFRYQETGQHFGKIVIIC